tara:strand:- start:1512 stop:3692 length:2181 start_codon:yes stop_codon:yes gene_type:complete
MNFKKVVIIGSGTMGSGIAAQVANAGINVILLDLPSKEGPKNQITEKAKDRILKSRPPLLVEKNKIDLIEAGNIEDNFNEIKDADWIVEAVVERIDIKHDIYKKIEEVRKDDSIISSNTSTIPLKVLSEKMSDQMKKNFCITHFFNPVRYMGLLEIVTEPINDKEKIDMLKSFCDEKLGKGVIICKDTPGFLGNRVGVYAMQVAMTEAFEMGLSIEEADAVFGRPMGIPKTGVFGLYDLIGIDLMRDVLKSFIKELPKEDPFHEVAQENKFITKMINNGYTGRKGKGGFYRMNKESGQKILEAINLKTGNYSPVKKINLDLGDTMNLKDLKNLKGNLGDYSTKVISKITKYVASLIPSVTESKNNIDEAMRLGFNWTIGPFEMAEDQNDEIKQNYLDSTLLTLRRIKNSKQNYLKKFNNSANYYHYEPNEYNIVEFKTKANALDSNSMDMLKLASDKNLIIINDSMQFSAGVNLNYVMEFAKDKKWNKIEKFIRDFQETCKKLKYSEFPVISAPSGLAIGGGFEIVAQSNYSVMHTNIVLGLVETLVGLIPAGGGCKEMLWRWMQSQEAKNDPDYAPLKVFDLIGYAKTATSPNEAFPHKFILKKDKIVINRDRLLDVSEKLLAEVSKDYSIPKKPVFKLSGQSVRNKMYEILEKLYMDKKILDHGLEVGKQLAFVLSGGNTNINNILSEEDLYALELEAFMNLIQMPKTQERIKHTLDTGKPLVN